MASTSRVPPSSDAATDAGHQPAVAVATKSSSVEDGSGAGLLVMKRFPLRQVEPFVNKLKRKLQQNGNDLRINTENIKRVSILETVC